jgi:hypothetical protein
MKKRKAPAAGPPSRPKAAPAATEPAVPARLLIIICALLALATIAIYAQTATHGYVAYDDDQYVYQNHWVKAGLTGANIAWAFTTFFYANWHPLTWLFYMLDFSLWGENPGAQHLENVAIHLASTLLLFLVFTRMTRRPWRAALVAAIFTVHPKTSSRHFSTYSRFCCTCGMSPSPLWRGISRSSSLLRLAFWPSRWQ